MIIISTNNKIILSLHARHALCISATPCNYVYINKYEYIYQYTFDIYGVVKNLVICGSAKDANS